jgi:hypothetical protein
MVPNLRPLAFARFAHLVECVPASWLEMGCELHDIPQRAEDLLAEPTCPMTPPQISCIIPVFTGKRYPWEALGSIRAQTSRPLEIIVDDDSPNAWSSRCQMGGNPWTSSGR